jgi:translation initiation factor 3 subunit M
MIGLGASLSPTNKDSFIDDLKEIISVCDVCYKEEKESDIESVLNSIVSVLIQVPQTSPDSYQLISLFCDQLVKAPNPKTALIALRV